MSSCGLGVSGRLGTWQDAETNRHGGDEGSVAGGAWQADVAFHGKRSLLLRACCDRSSAQRRHPLPCACTVFAHGGGGSRHGPVSLMALGAAPSATHTGSSCTPRSVIRPRPRPLAPQRYRLRPSCPNLLLSRCDLALPENWRSALSCCRRSPQPHSCAWALFHSPSQRVQNPARRLPHPDDPTSRPANATIAAAVILARSLCKTKICNPPMPVLLDTKT